MAESYIGEIRLFAGNFPPNGWMFCGGQLLSISEFDTLYNLIGTTYGGDGVTTFALPDLSGRFPMQASTSYLLSEKGGSETVTLTINQIPAHIHTLLSSTLTGNTDNPSGNYLAGNSIKSYGTGTPTVSMGSGAVQSVGGSQPHENMHPFLAVNFIISLYGIYPTQN